MRELDPGWPPKLVPNMPSSHGLTPIAAVLRRLPSAAVCATIVGVLCFVPSDLYAEPPDNNLPSTIPALPAGHPPLPGSHPRPDRQDVRDDPSLPAGTIIVETLGDLHKEPGSEVILQTWQRDDPEGKAPQQNVTRFTQDGIARFDGLTTSRNTVHQVFASYDDVPYPSPVFHLSESVGKRVTVRVFEVTANADDARVRVQASVRIDSKLDDLVVEQLLSFSNPSQLTWDIPSIAVPLPAGAHNFSVLDRGSVGADSSGGSLIFKGFVPPGSSDLVVRFHVPVAGSSHTLALQFPPRVSQLRVAAALPSEASIRGAQLPDPAMTRGDRGERLWIIESEADRIESASIEISNLPSSNWARRLAMIFAIFMIIPGLLVALRRREESIEDLLIEAGTLEQAVRSKAIDEATCQEAKALLVTRLANLLEKQSHNRDIRSGQAGDKGRGR